MQKQRMGTIRPKKEELRSLGNQASEGRIQDKVPRGATAGVALALSTTKAPINYTTPM